MTRRLRFALGLSTFLAIALGILGAAHYYLWLRLVRDAGWPPAVRLGASLALAALGTGMVATMILRRAFGRRATGFVQTALLAWMGIGLLLITGLGAVDLARLLFSAGRALGLGAGCVPSPESARLPALLGGGLGLGLSLIGLREGLRPPRLVEIEVPVPGLPPALEGLTIVQLTDLHIGPTLDARFLASVVERTNALSPDVVAITGDLVDGSVERLAPQVEPLRSLRAKQGVFFVPGNHDHYSGLEPWLAHLPSLGVTVLRNSSRVLGEGQRRFAVAGVDDPTARRLGSGGGPDVAAALAGIPAGLPVILLAHQPGSFDEAAAAGVALQLSGHTHGGQLFPFTFVVSLFQRYLAGRYVKGDSTLYVSRGTGFWGPPLRLLAPSELTKLVLKAA
ncbi:MAG: metallophosphoesterase [Myxococcales bacterium]